MNHLFELLFLWVDGTAGAVATSIVATVECGVSTAEGAAVDASPVVLWLKWLLRAMAMTGCGGTGHLGGGDSTEEKSLVMGTSRVVGSDVTDRRQYTSGW